jgi:hypothetical protein
VMIASRASEAGCGGVVGPAAYAFLLFSGARASFRSATEDKPTRHAGQPPRRQKRGRGHPTKISIGRPAVEQQQSQHPKVELASSSSSNFCLLSTFNILYKKNP